MNADERRRKRMYTSGPDSELTPFLPWESIWESDSASESAFIRVHQRFRFLILRAGSHLAWKPIARGGDAVSLFAPVKKPTKPGPTRSPAAASPSASSPDAKAPLPKGPTKAAPSKLPAATTKPVAASKPAAPSKPILKAATKPAPKAVAKPTPPPAKQAVPQNGPAPTPAPAAAKPESKPVAKASVKPSVSPVAKKPAKPSSSPVVVPKGGESKPSAVVPKPTPAAPSIPKVVPKLKPVKPVVVAKSPVVRPSKPAKIGVVPPAPRVVQKSEAKTATKTVAPKPVPASIPPTAKSAPKAASVPVPQAVVVVRPTKPAFGKKTASKPSPKSSPKPASKPNVALKRSAVAAPLPSLVVPKSVQPPPVKLEPAAISLAARALEEDSTPARSKDLAAPAGKVSSTQPPLPSILLSGDPDPVSSKNRVRASKSADSAAGVSQVTGSQKEAPSILASDAAGASAPVADTAPSPVNPGSGVSASPHQERRSSHPSQSVPAPAPAPASSSASRSALVLSGSVWVIARDPFTVCVHWDLPSAVVEAERARSPRGEWRLRLWQEWVGGTRISDQPLPLDTTHRFVPVMISGAGYVAEIGYQEASGQWSGWAISQPVNSPRESSRRDRERDRGRGWESDRATDSATESPQRPASGPVNPENLFGSVPDRSRGASFKPAGSAAHSQQWVVLEALQRILHREAQNVFAGSSERAVEWSETETQIPERRSRVDCGPELVPALIPSNPSSSEVSVPLLSPVSSEALATTPAVPPAPGFWFRVNAEVILYGSTERDATVTIAGRPVTLREDGSFSFRFLLPDGQFELPVLAVNATRTDGRSAEVTFARATTIRGDVGVHPAPPELKPPVPSAI